MKISVIIACHNRKSLTIECINRTQLAADSANVDVDFTVFDDGSTDGTFEGISSTFPSARVVQGDGTFYWAKSMAKAEEIVIQNQLASPSQYILWLNDDVTLDHDAFMVLLEIQARNPNSVIIGATRDAVSGETTYSGMRRIGLHPLKFNQVESRNYTQSVDTFNGNIVLVPLEIAISLGGIDGSFSHSLADIDYGLRCKRSNIFTVQAPNTLGTCSRNEIPKLTTMGQDWNKFRGPKGGGNYQSLKRILRKSNPSTWGFYIYASYALWWIRRIARSVKL